MTEENHVQQVATRENHVQQVNQENQVQRVTTKDLKKVEAGKRLAEYNHKKRKEQKSEVNQYYGIGAVLAVGVIGSLLLPLPSQERRNTSSAIFTSTAK